MSQDLLREAVSAAKQGDRPRAVNLTKQYIKANRSDERGWYALAKLIDDEDVKIKALERVLDLNPNHAKAQALLDELRSPVLSSNLFDFEDDEDADDDDVFTSSTFANEQTLFDDDSSVFDEPVREQPSKRAEKQHPQPQVKTAKQSGSNLEFVLGMGLFVFAIVGMVGLGYYAYFEQHLGLFGLFGPDLTETASIGEVQINHPADWESTTENGFLVASNYTPNANTVCPEELGDVLFAILGSFGLSLPEERVGFDPNETNYQMLLLPLDSTLLSQLNSCPSLSGLQSGRDYVEAMVGNAQIASDSGGGAEIRSDADMEDRTIAGLDGFYGFITLYFREDSTDTEFAYGNYAAAFVHNQQDYLFIMTTFGDGADSQHQLVDRILRTIELQS